jgi:hypothetical protein
MDLPVYAVNSLSPFYTSTLSVTAGTQLYSMYVGEGEAILRETFRSVADDLIVRGTLVGVGLPPTLQNKRG